MIVKLIDAILFLFFLLIALAVPLIDSQTCLPIDFYPPFLVELKQWYSHEFGDYLVSDKPHFFVGIIWLEIVFQWPLAIANIFAILTSKSWYNTTCLMYGVSVLTSMTAILSELMLSGKASDRLMMLYSPFMGLGVLAILRGLISDSSSKNGGLIIGRRPGLARKKRA